MKDNDHTRTIAETVVGAAIGAVIAGPIGAVAGGLVGSQTATHTKHLGEATAADEVHIVHGQLQRILVPLDFSDESEKALVYAISMARKFGAKISLLHVLPATYCAGEMGVVPEILPSGETVEKTRERLREIGGHRAEPELLEHFVVRDGVPSEQICNVARENGSELIVIATHGTTGLKHLLLGSTAERVAHQAPCPVLIVRERERDFA